MKRLRQRDLHEERGSIILALLGIVILTTVASVGLTSVVHGQKQTRHDNTYAASLDNASSGLDTMVAYIKNLPGSSTKQTLPDSTMYKNVTATPVLNLDTTGNPGSTTWTVEATGVATVQGHTILRTVNETVTIAHSYRTPVYGSQGLSLGQGSSVNDYDPANPSTTPDAINNSTLLQQLGIGGVGTVTVGVPNNGTPGAATVGNCTAAADTANNCLQIAGADAGNFSQIIEDNPTTGSPPPVDTCSAPAGSTTGSACGSSTVVPGTSPAPIITTPCNGDTTVALAGNPIISLPTAPVQLGVNVVPYPLTTPTEVCSQWPIVIPSLGGITSAVTGGLISLNYPIGFPIQTAPGQQGCALTGSLTGILTTATVNCTAPATPQLGIYSTNGAQITLGSACGAGQTGNQCPQTVVDAIIASPNGNCQINGDVTLFGAINCQTITFSAGATLTVEYPITLPTYNDVTHVDYVENWNEQHA